MSSDDLRYASTGYRGPTDFIPVRKKKPSPVRILLNNTGDSLTEFVTKYNRKLDSTSSDDYEPKKLKSKSGGAIRKAQRMIKEGDINQTIGQIGVIDG